jgi:hypothetical protein
MSAQSLFILRINKSTGLGTAVCLDGPKYTLSFPAALALLGHLRDEAAIRCSLFTDTDETFVIEQLNNYGGLLEDASAMIEVGQ